MHKRRHSGRKRFLGHGCVTLSRTLVVNQSRPESIEIRIHFYAFRSNEDFSVLIKHRIVRIKLYHKDERGYLCFLVPVADRTLVVVNIPSSPPFRKVFFLKMCCFLSVCVCVGGG